jgi:hypothetical protein
LKQGKLGKVADGFPEILPMRERAEILDRVLANRLENVLPTAMRESGLDMWLILCQEDDLDPVYETRSTCHSPTPRSCTTDPGRGEATTARSGRCSGPSWRRGIPSG